VHCLPSFFVAQKAKIPPHFYDGNFFIAYKPQAVNREQVKIATAFTGYKLQANLGKEKTAGILL